MLRESVQSRTRLLVVPFMQNLVADKDFIKFLSAVERLTVDATVMFVYSIDPDDADLSGGLFPAEIYRQMLVYTDINAGSMAETTCETDLLQNELRQIGGLV